jgi:TolB-like protein/tetratricopeptide (TPR) repeat protein/predicted Ser/Thr protein kinase
MTLKPGTQLGPYEILAPIGAGGMGEVWKARDTRLGRIVAIKKVKEQHSERFKQEARSIAALNHPYICQLHDIGEDYLVLEYIEGKPISSPMPEKEAVRLSIQIATALEAAHKKGIIHRDLKPANIMVTDEGSVKLLDFGLAKLYEQDASESTLSMADNPPTQTGAILGTVAYMSPEQAQGQTADARSDIFSFGLVLYEMLSGRRAFYGHSTSEVMAALLRDEPPALKASPPIEKIVRRCLAKQLSGRYQTMSEVKAALEQVFAEKATVTVVEPQPSIAVLPFVNMSGDKEQEYFSDGLAEEIINALTHIPGLQVIARTSAFAFKGKQEDIRRIAEMLGVANILEGSVRKAGNRIRVTAQLIAAADGTHLWSERYDRDLTDVFAIQDEIAAAIVGILEVKLSVGPEVKKRHEPNPAANEAYLKARYLWGKHQPEFVARSKEYLEQAIALDPRFALAHCGYADHILFFAGSGYLPAHEAMPRMREEARKALEIDPSLPEAHAMLGIVAAGYDYDWKEAERCFHLAMAHDPVLPLVRQWYGFMYLLPIGRTEEAVRQCKLGVQEDPLNVIARTSLGAALMNAQRLADAQVELHKVLEFGENHPSPLLFLALTYARQEKWAEALYIAEKATPMLPWIIGILAGVLKRMGEVDRSEKLVQKLMSSENYDVPIGLSLFYLVCGEIDRAAEWWEKVIEQRSTLATNFGSVFFRSTSRWPELARLMNLPEKIG